jgi:hypothetical protein
MFVELKIISKSKKSCERLHGFFYWRFYGKVTSGFLLPTSSRVYKSFSEAGSIII